MLLEVWAPLQVKVLTQDWAHEDALEVVAGTSGLALGLSDPGAGRPRWWAARHGEMRWTVGPGVGGECEVECRGQGWGKGEGHAVGGHNLKEGGPARG